MMLPSQPQTPARAVSAALEAHAKSQRSAAARPEPRVADEPRTITPAVAEIIRYTFGA